MASTVPTDDPLAVSTRMLAHRMNVTRLRLAAGASLCEISQHVEAVVQDACATLLLISSHPDQDAVLEVDDLGPDADFVSTHLG